MLTLSYASARRERDEIEQLCAEVLSRSRMISQMSTHAELISRPLSDGAREPLTLDLILALDDLSRALRLYSDARLERGLLRAD